MVDVCACAIGNVFPELCAVCGEARLEIPEVVTPGSVNSRPGRICPSQSADVGAVPPWVRLGLGEAAAAHGARVI